MLFKYRKNKSLKKEVPVNFRLQGPYFRFKLGYFFSNHSMIALIAHTKPAPNIPSKNTDKNLFSPTYSTFGEKYANDKKKPTHVPVHNIQEIRPDRNLPKKFNGAYLLLPHLLIPVLSPLNIEPYTKIVVIP